MIRGAWLALLAVALAAPARAQGKAPVGPFVVDARGLMAGLPIAEGWLPALPPGTVVPSRGFGLELGGHVYPLARGPVRIGLGGAVSLARGTTSSTTEGTPDVTSRSSTIAPQVSFNFGHRLGWSHLSIGYGAARVSSDAAGGPAGLLASNSGWVGAINFGGGARWFVRDHVGIGFDARWHRLGARPGGTSAASAPGTTLFQLALGLSLH